MTTNIPADIRAEIDAQRRDMSAERIATTEIVGDYVVDTATGEVLGLAGFWQRELKTKEDAEEVLAARFRTEARLAGVKTAQDLEIAGIKENYRREITDLENRVTWLTAFDPALEAIAIAEGIKARDKDRFLQLPHGRLFFTKSQGGAITVKDDKAAIAWAEKNCPAAVKVEKSILKTPLKGRTDLPDAFEVSSPSDKCTVETGIGK